MSEKFVSPRQAEQDIRDYKHARFEAIWQKNDAGEITRAELIAQCAIEWADASGELDQVPRPETASA